MLRLSRLIKVGASPSALTIPARFFIGGETSALIIAASRNWTSVVRLFMESESLDANVVDVDGEHALLAALKSGSAAAAELLISRSNTKLKDDLERSCLSLAIRKGLRSTAFLIVEHMGEGESKDELARMKRERPYGCQEFWSRVTTMLLSNVDKAALIQATEAAEAGLNTGSGRRRL